MGALDSTVVAMIITTAAGTTVATIIAIAMKSLLSKKYTEGSMKITKAIATLSDKGYSIVGKDDIGSL